jgi:hypothetical protein
MKWKEKVWVISYKSFKSLSTQNSYCSHRSFDSANQPLVQIILLFFNCGTGAIFKQYKLRNLITKYIAIACERQVHACPFNAKFPWNFLFLENALLSQLLKCSFKYLCTYQFWPALFIFHHSMLTSNFKLAQKASYWHITKIQNMHVISIYGHTRITISYLKRLLL